MRRIIFIFALALFPAVLVGEGDSGQKFVKIIHTVDMSVAVDSSGQTWRYDKEEGEFVRTRDSNWKRAQSAGSGRRDYDEEDVLLPPEVRCTKIIHGDINEWFDEVVVEIDERVEGKITSRRDVIVKGLVTGDIFSGQTVTVESSGEVRGDIVAKEIRRERGGRILGQRDEVLIPDINFPQISRSSEGTASILVMVFLVFICLITVALAPKYVGVVFERVQEEVVKSFFWGLLGWFSILPLFILLVITIVGIPVAILVLPLLIVICIILAFAAITVYLGGSLAKRLSLPSHSRHLLGVFGTVALTLPLLAAAALGFIGADVLSILGYVFFGLFMFLAVTIGLGATISTRLGTRAKPTGGAPGTGPQAAVPPVSPPPPPDPESPPLSSPPPPVSPPPPPT